MDFAKSIIALLFAVIGISCGAREGYQMEMAFKDEIAEVRKNIGDVSLTQILSASVQSSVKFILFTRNGLGELLMPEDLYSFTVSHFDIHKPTKVLIHGYWDNANGEMVTTIVQNFLLVEDINVIVVDWGNISMSINYIGAALKSVEVGHYLGDLIDFLISRGADIEDFHIIGFSLGAHVAGTAGRSVKSGKIPRITGLDPALPGFGYLSLFYKLQPSDALFVDCIHTCGGLLGFFDALCHADFYANGGRHPQPGCPLLDFGKCSHFRSFRFFAESILNHKFPSLRCNYITPDSRDCEQLDNSEEILMGNYVKNSTRGLFYVYTNSGYPYSPAK